MRRDRIRDALAPVCVIAGGKSAAKIGKKSRLAEFLDWYLGMLTKKPRSDLIMGSRINGRPDR